MASCIGAGDLLASILNRGVHSIEVQQVKKMLELLRITYSNPYPHIIHFGGMFGVVNAMGAGAGNMFHQYSLTTSFQTIYERKESSRIMCPLLESSAFVPLLVSLIQDMFLGAQNSDNHQLRHYAAWAVSFLRHHFWSRDGHNYTNSHKNDSVSCKPVSQKFPEDSSIMQLSLWLMHFDYSQSTSILHVNTMATVLRCFSQAPALPGFDWGAVIRRTMRYEDQVAKLLPPDSVYEKGTLCEECILFSLAHANKFEQLLSLVDELTDLSRFRVLDLNLQCCVLHHLSDLIRIFASSRLEKLFNDISVYFASPISAYQTYNLCRKSSLRISCWKGICQCLGDDSLSTSSEYISSMEKCMEVLFSLLPEYRTVAMSGQNKVLCTEEWNEATRCLAKARRGLLSDLLQVSEIDLIQRDDYFSVIAKKILVRAWLVRLGSLPLTELGKLKNVYILNTGSHDLWDVHVGVVTALQLADGGVQRQWLIDVLEISCITKYPSTALRFLGLLSGSCCRYMPFLILDPKTVLSDLPLTLSSLLSTPNWSTVAETAVSYLWASTERVHEWATSLASGSEAPSLQLQPIDQSENEMADFLLLVMHSACVSLKEYLPLDKKLKLANMAVR
ncbi:hypothetical protein Nepgr_026070 [Nepenthes gracilis]|uniref:Uncharacterized protein n=1 Tax=Nepenthes gracilis TaxID=150966 RepID=A0AAD3T905_NEPGR|nr:hypothetical protein Nepgr_026070 [Nepenthes gracilis]